MGDIAGWRKRIDEIDAEIVKLVNERAACAIEIGKIKRTSGNEIYDPDRERLIFERLSEINDGPLDSESIVKIFQQIIEECRAKESEST